MAVQPLLFFEILENTDLPVRSGIKSPDDIIQKLSDVTVAGSGNMSKGKCGRICIVIRLV